MLNREQKHSGLTKMNVGVCGIAADPARDANEGTLNAGLMHKKRGNFILKCNKVTESKKVHFRSAKDNNGSL